MQMQKKTSILSMKHLTLESLSRSSTFRFVKTSSSFIYTKKHVRKKSYVKCSCLWNMMCFDDKLTLIWGINALRLFVSMMQYKLSIVNRHFSPVLFLVNASVKILKVIKKKLNKIRCENFCRTDGHNRQCVEYLSQCILKKYLYNQTKN